MVRATVILEFEQGRLPRLRRLPRLELLPAALAQGAPGIGSPGDDDGI